MCKTPPQEGALIERKKQKNKLFLCMHFLGSGPPQQRVPPRAVPPCMGAKTSRQFISVTINNNNNLIIIIIIIIIIIKINT